jgi:hypothetical protein
LDWSATSELGYSKSTGLPVGIFLHPTPQYASRKEHLSQERLKSLVLAEEAIAADPDRYEHELDGVRFDAFDEFVAVAFRPTGPNDADLISFAFYDED